MCVCAFVHVCVCACACVRARARTHTHTRARTHTHIHTHTCVRAGACVCLCVCKYRSITVSQIPLVHMYINPFQRTNLILYQLRDFADDNFKFDEMAQSFPNREKTLWEKEKFLVKSNFFISHSVFKRLLLGKKQGLFWKGLNIRLLARHLVCILLYFFGVFLHSQDCIFLTLVAF